MKFLGFAKRRTVIAGLAVSVAVATGASGAASGAITPKTKAPVLFDVYSPFSGPNAFIGNTYNLPPVKLAVNLINKAGGVLGSPVQVVTTDSGADPADAIPAVQAMLVKYSHVNAIFGVTSDVAPAVVPILNRNKLLTISEAGTPSLAKNPYSYYFQLLPPDSFIDAGIVGMILDRGYKRVAMIYDSTGTSQSDAVTTAPLVRKHGGKIVLNETVQDDQPSYSVEVEKLIQSHPQVILTETDPQTAATIFAEVKQLGSLTTPVVSVNNTPQYFSAVAKAVGGYSVERKFMYVESPTAAATPGMNFMLAQGKLEGVNGPGPALAGMYDGATIVALAMDEAHSTEPAVYLKYIKRITNDSHGTKVTNYAQGLAAIRKGNQISFDGAAGIQTFNQYNWSPEGESLYQITASGGEKSIFHLAPDAIDREFFPAS